METFSVKKFIHPRLQWIHSFIVLTATLQIADGQATNSTSLYSPVNRINTTTNALVVTNGTSCEDWWENEGRSSLDVYPIFQHIVVAVQIFIVFFTVFGNLLVIVAVSTFHELQTITNMFVASLACADLIMGAVVMPVGIPYVMHGRWALGSLFCDIWISIDVLTVTASIGTLCAIAMDRYLAITKPFTYTASVTRSRARCFIAFIWITAASIAFIPVQLGWWKDDSMEAKCCYDISECCEFMTNKTYATVSSFASFYIPLALMIFSYSIVFKEAIRLASQIDDQSGVIRRASMPGTNRPLWNREQRRTVFTFGYIMGIFTVCWLPFFIVNLAQAFSPGCVRPSVFTTLNWFGYANSFFNPFIYSHNAQFRQAFLRILTCLPCSEGFERTKRASLSDSFPRYRNNSSRDSTLHSLSAFFLAGGSSRKRSTKKSTPSTFSKRDSSVSSGRSPTRSPLRQTRFRIGSEDLSGTQNINSDNRKYFDNNNLELQPLTVPAGKSIEEQRSVTFTRNGFHRTSTFSQESENNTNSLCKESQLNSVDEHDVFRSITPPTPRSVLKNQKSGESETVQNGEISSGRGFNNGLLEIRTRRSKSLFVTLPFGIFSRSHSPRSETNTNLSCTDLTLLKSSGNSEESKNDTNAVLVGIHAETFDPAITKKSPS